MAGIHSGIIDIEPESRPPRVGMTATRRTYCPHLDPAERLWGLMHKHVTHNRCHATFADFKAAVLTVLREEVPRKWHVYCDQVTDNFRIISPKEFRVLT